MIKKYILSVVIVLFSIQMAQSQVLISLLLGDKLNSESLKFGLEGGVNFSNVTNLPTSTVGANFNLGFYFDFMLGEDSNWFIHSGVLVKSTYGANLDPYSLNDKALDSLFADGSVRRRIQMFNIPGLVRYKFKKNVFIELGPVISLRYKATDIFTASIEDKKDLTFHKDISDDLHRIDFGFEAGIGYSLKVLHGMNAGVRYYQGVMNSSKLDTPNPQMNTSYSIYVAIPIGAGPKAQAKNAAAAKKRAAKKAEKAKNEKISKKKN